MAKMAPGSRSTRGQPLAVLGLDGRDWVRSDMSTPVAYASVLAEQIAKVALLRGTFTLRSGKTSSYYMDKYLFSMRPELLRQLSPLFARAPGADGEDFRQEGRPALAGAELGGIPLVTATRLHTGHPCIFVRNKKKDYGTGQAVGRRATVEKGDVIVLVEDVATTGGQALEAVESLREAGAGASAGRDRDDRSARGCARKRGEGASCSRRRSPSEIWASRNEKRTGTRLSPGGGAL